MWLIAGPNGSGKSTIVDHGFIETVSGETVIKLNADAVTRSILVDSPGIDRDVANLEAAISVDTQVDQLIEECKSFAVETVLSSDKYRARVDRAKNRGFIFAIVYVTLTSAQDCIDRVNLRVQQGGHSVPDEKIRARWERSHENLPWFVARADVVLIFDNTSPAIATESPVLLASKELNGKLSVLRSGIHQRIDAALRTLRT